MQHIGILGGTFNPIHFGHLRIAEELKENLKLDQVRFIPSANPPHKDAPKVTAEQRAAMVALAIAENTSFVLDEQELNRTGASYTIDTLKQLRRTLGDTCSISFIMGSDAFVHLESWHQWESLLDYTHLVLVNRTQSAPTPKLSTRLETYLGQHYTEDPDLLAESENGFIHMQAVTSLTISSTFIRKQSKAEQSIRYLTPTKVIDYINQHQLYL